MEEKILLPKLLLVQMAGAVREESCYGMWALLPKIEGAAPGCSNCVRLGERGRRGGKRDRKGRKLGEGRKRKEWEEESQLRLPALLHHHRA